LCSSFPLILGRVSITFDPQKNKNYWLKRKKALLILTMTSMFPQDRTQKEMRCPDSTVTFANTHIIKTNFLRTEAEYKRLPWDCALSSPKHLKENYFSYLNMKANIWKFSSSWLTYINIEFNKSK
jgi:hypothetical protein